MAKKISMNKVRRQIAVALHVSNEEAQQMVPMFIRKAA